MTDTQIHSILISRFASVRGRIAAACQRAGRNSAGITLVAVTKTVSAGVAAIASELGAFDLGESRPQSLWEKAAALPTARWHLIGHLQRNKIERTVPLATLIHSVDSTRLLESLDTFGRQHGQRVPVLLEVNCSNEESKGGFKPAEVPGLSERIASLTGVEVRGLMTMAGFFDDPDLCRPAFVQLRQLRDELRGATGLLLPELSMGMSNDFEVAIEEEATLVRVGTTLFEGLAGE